MSPSTRFDVDGAEEVGPHGDQRAKNGVDRGGRQSPFGEAPAIAMESIHTLRGGQPSRCPGNDGYVARWRLVQGFWPAPHLHPGRWGRRLTAPVPYCSLSGSPRYEVKHLISRVQTISQDSIRISQPLASSTRACAKSNQTDVTSLRASFHRAAYRRRCWGTFLTPRRNNSPRTRLLIAAITR